MQLKTMGLLVLYWKIDTITVELFVIGAYRLYIFKQGHYLVLAYIDKEKHQ